MTNLENKYYLPFGRYWIGDPSYLFVLKQNEWLKVLEEYDL